MAFFGFISRMTPRIISLYHNGVHFRFQILYSYGNKNSNIILRALAILCIVSIDWCLLWKHGAEVPCKASNG